MIVDGRRDAGQCAREAAEATGAPEDVATALLGWGGFLLEAGRPAMAVLEEAVQRFGELGDPHGEAGAMVRLAVATRDPARFAAAERLAGDHPTRRAALEVHRGHLDLDQGSRAAAERRLPDGPCPARVRFAARLLDRALHGS